MKTEVSGTHSIKSNIFFNLLKTFLSLIFPLITFPYVSRVLTPVGVGNVNYASSIVSYFVMFAGLGIGVYGIREGAKVRDDKQKLTELICELLIITFVAMLVAYIAFFIVVFTVPQFAEFKALLLVLGANIFFNVIGIEWLYSALEEFRYITIRSFCFQLLSLVLIFTLVKTPDDFFKYAVITVVSASGSNVFNFLHARRFLDWRLVHHLDWGRHIKSILIMFGMTMTGSILTMMDTTMVGLISGTYQVGLYTTALKIVKLICSLIIVVSSTAFPTCSYLLGNNELGKYMAFLEKCIFVTVFLIFPATLLAYTNATFIITTLAGNAYKASIPCMKLLSPIIIFDVIAVFVGYQILLPNKMEKINLIELACGAGIDFIFNLILIPKYGAQGACLGTLFAEITMFCISVAVLFRYIPVKRCFENLLPLFIPCMFFVLMCFCISIFFTESVCTKFFGSIASGIIYILLVFAFDKKKCLFSLLKNKKGSVLW